MTKRLVCILMAVMLVLGMMPATAFAADDIQLAETIMIEEAENVTSDEEIEAPSISEETDVVDLIEEPAEETDAPEVDVEEPEVAEAEDLPLLGASESNEATGRAQGPKGSEDVAVFVYGELMRDALTRANSFSDFVNIFKGAVQGILANEKLPTVELYLVNDKNEEYRLTTSDAPSEAAMISSIRISGSGVGKVIEYLGDVNQWLWEKILDGVDTKGELYKIYGAQHVPEGNYTLEIRSISGDGYSLYAPATTTFSVHVGDDNVNYIGYPEPMGSTDLAIDIPIVGEVDFGNLDLHLPGVFLRTVHPGLYFQSADLGGNALPGTEFVLINRDETVNIVKAAFNLGKDTFTNAMNLVGTDGYEWKDLSLLYNQLLKWDEEGQQIALNEEQAYKLLVTYWSLIKASAMDPTIEFMSNDTNVRIPAILKATADSNGRVYFGEKSNVTLTWSIEILLRMGHVVLDDISKQDIDDLDLNDDETEAIVRLVLSIAKYAMEKGVDYLDENGQVMADFINDWIYPIMQNDNMMVYAKKALLWFIDEDDLTEEDKKMLELLPQHALLTKKMPAGNYIMFESSVPDGYINTPLFYSINIEWHTESENPRDWCYASVGNVGILLPYFAEEYYDYLRSYNASAEADKVLNWISDGKTGTMIQDIISDKTDVSALMITYYSGIVYNYMGGKYLYDSELELAADLTKYLYAHGRTAQNLLIFGNEIAKKSKSVVTDEINYDWTFYTYSTSIRTNLALRTKSILQKIADSIDTTGGNAISTTAKDIVQKTADSIDTTNRIIEQTTAIKNKIEDKVKSTASSIGSKLLSGTKDAIKTVFRWSQKY